MITKAGKAFCKGCLEVRAIRDTEKGLTGVLIPKGSIGYAHGARDGKTLVFWPHFKGKISGTDIHYNDSFRMGSVNSFDIEPTGKRL